jgi:methylphosphotriester-DNA--protein-cysteine methyltransferase
MMHSADRILHSRISDRELREHIRKGWLVLGGNRKLKIYGLLSCASGKRMLRDNRVFFPSETAAINAGYRPCGHCLKTAYEQWKIQ